jgi:hypothetical protein
MPVGNTKPVGVAYSDPNFDRLFVADVEILSAPSVALLTATAGTATASKAVILDTNKAIDAVRTAALYIGTSGGETQVTATGAEINKLAGVTGGTTTASKALVVDANKALDTLALPTSGLKIGAGAGTAVTASAAELNVLTGVTGGTTSGSKALVVDANKALDTLALPTSGLKIGAGAGTAVTSTAAELNKNTGVAASVTVTVTTPGASGTCDAAFQFKDAAGANIAFASSFASYLSGVDGLSITAAITSIATADTPVGAVANAVTGQQNRFVTNATGAVSAKLTGAAATTYYITFIGPGGRLITSPAILTKA